MHVIFGVLQNYIYFFFCGVVKNFVTVGLGSKGVSRFSYFRRSITLIVTWARRCISFPAFYILFKRCTS